MIDEELRRASGGHLPMDEAMVMDCPECSSHHKVRVIKPLPDGRFETDCPTTGHRITVDARESESRKTLDKTESEQERRWREADEKPTLEGRFQARIEAGMNPDETPFEPRSPLGERGLDA